MWGNIKVIRKIANGKTIIRVIGAVSFWILQIGLPNAQETETYPAVREYRLSGNGMSGLYPSFAAAGKAAFDAYAIPSYWPDAAKTDWWAASPYPGCQTKQEPGFVSGNAYVGIWTTLTAISNPASVMCTWTNVDVYIQQTCPAGGYLRVDQCLNAPACPVGKVRNPLTALCESSKLKSNGIPVRELCVGNPLNSGTGNKFESEADYTGAGLYPLEFRRSYNSQQNTMGGIGYNRRLSYGGSIALSLNSASATVYRPDGKVITFGLSNGVWKPEADISDSLMQISGASGWRYLPTNGTIENYDAAGRRVLFSHPTGLFQTLTYSDGTTGPNGGYILDVLGNPTATASPSP